MVVKGWPGMDRRSHGAQSPALREREIAAFPRAASRPVKRHRAIVLPLLLLLCACSSGQGSPSPVGLVVRLTTCTNPCEVDTYRTVDYLADGMVIRSQAGTLEANTLTATGMATLRGRLAQDTDLLTGPLRLMGHAVPNTPGQVIAWAQTDTFFMERPDGSRYAVSAVNSRLPTPATWLHDAATDRLTALSDDLADPVALVGEAGLTQPRWAPYQAALTGVFISLSGLPPCDPSTSLDGPLCAAGMMPAISMTGWPFGDSPGTIGTEFRGPGDPGTTWRCAFLPSDRVRSGIAGLRTPGSSFAKATLDAGTVWGNEGLFWDTTSPQMTIGLAAVPLMPEDEAASCNDAHFQIQVQFDQMMGSGASG
jgi:hypothetical protein